MIASLILGVVVFCLMLSVSKRFGAEKKEAMRNAGIGGLAIALVNFSAPKVPSIVGMILYFVIAACSAYLVIWWTEDGSTVKELIHFIVIGLLLSITGTACLVRIKDFCSISLLNEIVSTIPAVVFILSTGYMIADMIWFHDELQKY